MNCRQNRVFLLTKAFLLVFVCSAAGLHAADVFWKAPVDGDWNDPNNWLGNNVPGINDDVFITTSGTYQVTLDVLASVRSLEVGGTSGTQSLVSVGQNIAVGFNSRIGTHGNLFLGTADFSGGVILENFGSIGLLSGGIFAELHNYGGVFMQNADLIINPKLDGPVKNFTSGTIQIFSANFFSTVGEFRSPVENFGLIEMKSLNLNGTSKLELQDTFVNRGGSKIETLPGSDLQVEIQIVSLGLMSNEGVVQVGTPTIINNSSTHPVTNAGLMIVTSSVLRIAQAPGLLMENPGRIQVDSGQEMLIQGGDFSPTSSGSIDGTGTITFAAIRIVDHKLRCTSAVTGLVGCELTTTAQLFNSGIVRCFSDNVFNGEVENATTGVLELHALDVTSSVLFVNNTMTNNGVLVMTSSSLSADRVALLRICDTQLFCKGVLLSSPTPGAAFTPHTVQNKNSSFFLSGQIIVATDATLSMINAGSSLAGDGGTFRLSGSNSILNIANRGSLTSTFASITISSIRTEAPGAQLRVAQTTRSSLHIFRSSITTTASLFNSGLFSVNGGECIAQNSMLCNGPGTHNFENVILSGSFFCRSTTSSFDIVDVTSRSGSDIHLLGFGSLGGCNRFRGSFTVGTTASCFLIDPQRGPVDASQGQKNFFSQGLTNHGCIQVQTFATNATIGILNGQFHNTGKLELGSSPAGFNLFCTGSSVLLNGTGGTIVNQSDGLNNGRPGRFLFLDSSKLINFGDIIFSTALNIATTEFDFGSQTVFLNDGVFVFRTFSTRSTISISSSTVFVNRGTLEFDQGKSGATGGLFRDDESLLPPVNSGIFVIRNFSTPNTFVLRDKDSIDNTGAIRFENNSAPTTVELRDSSHIYNKGDIEFIKCITAKLAMRSATRMTNDQPGRILFNEADTACVRIINNSEYRNCASTIFQGCTIATLRLDDFARLINKVGAKVEARNFKSEGNLQLTTSAVLRNAGLLSFHSFSTTCIISASENSRIENETGGTFNLSTGAILRFHMSQTAQMLNCGLLRLQSMSNATMTMENLTHFSTKSGGTTLFGPDIGGSSVELKDSSTFRNGGETTFLRNLSTAVRMFDSSRLIVQTSSSLRFIGSGSLDLTSSLVMNNSSQFDNHGRCEMENSSNCSIQMLNSCRIINSTGATIKLSTSGVARFTQEGGSLFINDGSLGLLTVSEATVEVKDNSRLKINGGGILDIRGPILEGKIQASGNGALDNGGTVRILVDSARSTIRLNDSSQVQNHTGATIEFIGGGRGGGIFIDGTSRVDNGGTCRFRNFASTATIFLGDATRWENKPGAEVKADSSRKFRILCYGGSLFNNCGEVQCLTTTSGSIFLGGNSTFNNKSGATTLFGDGFNGGLRVRTSTNALFCNGGDVRFRNFATTATIFMGDSSRWKNKTSAEVSFMNGSSGEDGVKIDLSGAAGIANDGALILRNVKSDGTLCLGDSTRWDNKVTGRFDIDSTRTFRILCSDSSVFNNCGQVQCLTTTSGSIILGGNSLYNNKLGATTLFGDGGSGGLKIEAGTNATFSNGGTFRFRNFATTATIFLGDSSRWQNKTSAEVSFLNGASGRDGAVIRLGDSAEAENNGEVKFRNFATTATIFLGDSSRWENKTTGRVTADSTNRTRIILFDDSRFNNCGLYRCEFATTCHIIIGGNARLNNKNGGRLLFSDLGNKLKVETSTNGIFTNDGITKIDRCPSATFKFRGSSRFQNHGKMALSSTTTTAGLTVTHEPPSVFVHSGCIDITRALMRVKLPRVIVLGATEAGVQLATTSIWRFETDGGVEFHGGHADLGGRFSGDGKLIFRDAKIDVQGVKLGVSGTNAAIKLIDTEWNSSATVSPWITRVPLCLGGRSTLNVVMTTANRTVMRASTEGLLHLNFKLPATNTGQVIFNRTIPNSRIDFDPGVRYNNLGRILISNVVTSTEIRLGTNAQFCHQGLLSITTAELSFVHETGARLKFVSTAIVDIDRSTVNIVTSSVFNTTIPGNVILRGGGEYNVGNVRLAGTLVPGRSPGKLVFPDDIAMASTATLEYEIGGATTAGIAYDQICADDVTLGGTLDVTFINGYTPANSDRIVLMKYNSVTGAFASVTYANLSATPNLEIGATEAVLTFSGGVSTSIVNVDVYLHGYWNGSEHRRTPLLLELRTGADLLTSSTAVLTTTLLSTSASTSFAFEGLPQDDYWVILRHGGHLPAASISRINIAPGTTAVDFTDPANVVNGAIQLLPLTIGATTYNVLRTGDMNNNQDVGSDDFIQYFLPNFGVANPGFVPELD